MIREEMGKFTGIVAMIGILGIMIILLAVLALVVVNALVGSPWGMFTIAMTIPIVVFMGIYMRYIRPGRVSEASVIGFVLLLLSIYGGKLVVESPTLAPMFTFSGETIAIMLIVYGFIASVLPVWILFEALFILTIIDAGTRVCRFMIQDILGNVYKPLGNTDSWGANILATLLAASGWGCILYQGVIDPLGGINTLWPLFGISNQMLAAIVLIFGTTVLFKMGKKCYAWVTIVTMVFLLVVTMTAGYQKLFDPNSSIGFLSHAEIFKDSVDRGEVLAPAEDMGDMKQIIFNDTLNAGLTLLFMIVVTIVFVAGGRQWIQISKNKEVRMYEEPYVSRSPEGDSFVRLKKQGTAARVGRFLVAVS